jgi:hypothetical protein
MAMSEAGGWLWAILGLIGVGGLGLAIAYGAMQWQQRPKDAATREHSEEATRANYRSGG